MSRALTRCLFTLLFALGVAAPAGAAVFTVTKTDDTDDGVCDADCSLREAIGAANADSGASEIDFAIPGGGVQTISPTSELPAVQSPVTINGFTQGGDCSAPQIELDGHLAGTANGLRLLGDGTHLEGLVINRFAAGDGIEILGAGSLITCNFIGTDPAGTQALANFNGIRVEASNATIGNPKGLLPTGNLISGNTEVGIRVEGVGVASATVTNNQIGTDATGSGQLGNGASGVYFADGTADSSVEANVIAHNGAGSVWVYGDTTHGISIRGNSTFDNGGIGIDLIGTVASVGTTPNDPGDPDEGPNRLQNTPAPGTARLGPGAGQLTVRYRVDTDPANATYPLDVDFYRDEALGDEGEVYLGSASFSAADFAAGTLATAALNPSVPPGIGDVILATATDAAGNTSEFATIDEVTGPAAGIAGLAALVALRRRAL